MSKIDLDLNLLTFGSDDAELDEKRGFLSRVFLKTSIYHRVENSFRELVIGRKGSGKSAICLMLRDALERKGNSALLITPESLAQYKIEQLKISSINREESFVLSWKYILLVTLAKQVLERAKKNKPKKKDLKKQLNEIRGFLVANNEIDGNIFDGFSKKANLLSKLSIGAYGIEGAIETRQLKAQDDSANELEKFQQTLIGLLAEMHKTGIALLIDKVDDIWNQTEESEMMIIGLLKAIHVLNASLKNVLILVFLRSDIYDTLKFNDADKFHSLEEWLDWQEEDLKRLIALRGKVSAGLRESDVDSLWNVIFDVSVKGKSSFNYMVERTFKRPRDLIQFCNSALTKAQDNEHEYITSDDILEAEKQYSNWKLKDIASEFRIQYPYLDELLGLFQAFKTEFSVEEFDERFQDSKPRFAKFPELQATSTNKALQLLFIVGFLGTKKNGEQVFVYDDPLILLVQEERIVIHPVFYLALGLKSVVVVDGSMEGTIIQGDININVAGDIVGRDTVVYRHYSSREVGQLSLDSFDAELGLLLLKKMRLQERIAVYGGNANAPIHLKIELADIETKIAETGRKIEITQAYLASGQ